MDELHRWEEQPPKPERTGFPTKKKELLFGLAMLLCGMALINFVCFGGLHLGFAIAGSLCIIFSAGYLLCNRSKPSVYGITVLVLCVVLCASFGRSDDDLVKFVMVCFLLGGVNLGLCLLAGKNRYDAGRFRSLADSFRTLFSLGHGKIPDSFYGLRQAFRHSGSAGKKGGAIALGLCIAMPILAVMIGLLIRADAAFDDLLSLLPEFDFSELPATVVLGAWLALVLYTRCIALQNANPATPGQKERKGLDPLTLNTVLGAVALVYLVYLFSQLAYFTGGFAGSLPAQYTLAQYARRGFFEMAWLCVINLCVICLGLGVCRQKPAPLSCRLLCCFIGFITAFLIATASAKMFLYIDGYGLTRLRVLTQVVMIFLALVTVLVMAWLFNPKFKYMQTIVVAALAICAAVSWADVDTQVANYNVDAYLSGQLDSVDVDHLADLGDGAIPALHRLALESDDPGIADKAAYELRMRYHKESTDFRDWNAIKQTGTNFLKVWQTKIETDPGSRSEVFDS